MLSDAIAIRHNEIVKRLLKTWEGLYDISKLKAAALKYENKEILEILKKY